MAGYSKSPQQQKLQLNFRLPKFKMKRRSSTSRIIKVTCPHDATHIFWLDGKIWAHSSSYNTRPCPYCFKACRIREGA